MGLEGTLNNARNITGTLNGIGAEIRSGRGSLGSLIYTDSLSKGLEKTVSSANFALLTVQKAADNFSENMKALQGNYFLRGYFKKKAKKEAAAATDKQSEEEPDMTDEELEQMKQDAEKELQRRKTKSSGNPANGG